MVKIILHGTGAGHPSADRGASAASVTFENGAVLLLDTGEGCSRALLRDGVDPGSIGWTAISHMHADHWAGFPNLVMGWVLGGRTDPVEVFLPPETEEFFRNILIASYLVPERRSFAINFHALELFSLPDGWTLRPFRTSHLDKHRTTAEILGLSFPSFGYILEKNGQKIVFSQDLASESDLQAELPGAQLVICELAHINPARMLHLADKNGVKKVLFTHVPPDPPELPYMVTDVEWTVAHDGMTIKL